MGWKGTIVVRSAQWLVLGLGAVCLVGCSGSPSGRSSSPSATPSPARSELAMTTGARSAANAWYRLAATEHFSASWQLLNPAFKKKIPLKVWVEVHQACPTASTRVRRTITSVTVFGTAAIVTEKVTGPHMGQGTSSDVFNFTGGQWTYSPNDINIYQHSSVAADVAAAKAAGLCDGSKSSPL
jgi:hypothetical protein